MSSPLYRKIISIFNFKQTMKRTTNYLFIVLLGTLVFLNACDNGGTGNPAAPKVVGPNNIISVQIGTSTEISFVVAAVAGYKAATASSLSGGITEIMSEPSAGSASGTIVVKYTAPNATGADQVNVTISDNASQTATGATTVEITSTPPPPSNEVLSGIIDANKTLTADRIYELAGRVIVEEGVTLTIEAGTILKGREGQNTTASALIISRGAKIDAQGTAEKPIIFTSILDNIQVGEFKGSNLSKEDNEKWGGLIILGKAPISAGNGDTESNIEGLPADEPFAKYGGTVADDNSGTINYVSIRHGGITIGDGNEINGLTLGGVGSGTTIENIEIYATLDDGIELFGGTVNIKNAVIAWQGDDGVDIDQNYAGTVENFAVSHGVGVGTDEGLEIDGPEGTTNTSGLFTVKNGTIINDGGAEGSPGDFKDKAQGTVDNIKFMGYASTQIKIRASYTNDCMDAKTDAFANLIAATPKLIFTKSNFDSNKVYTSSKNAAGTETCTVSQGDQDAANAKMVKDDTAIGADMTAFDWTLSKEEGLLE